jgi:hypothetical protein
MLVRGQQVSATPAVQRLTEAFKAAARWHLRQVQV